MVKKVDEIRVTPLIDHVGWRLWRASQAWMGRFQRDMVAAGHPVFAEARAQLIPHIDREGTRQSDLVLRMGLSKQAVQQLVVGLERDGLIERLPDPDDARGKVVAFTERGQAMLTDANDVKKTIEKEYRTQLGAEGFAQLVAALDRLDETG
ncbi:MAG: MarR family transcriptional regulator [Cytophagales bacterium]|nr:MarR family transcriptional regulator [Rhizobacter sp.]